MRLLGHTAVTLASAALVTTMTAAPATAADSWPVPSSATITITGHGFGHGHGMSQWGAQGAGLQGLSHRQILDFYYPGLRPAKAGGRISVLIGADTTTDVVVERAAGLVVKSLAKKKVFKVARIASKARAFKLKPRGSTTLVQARTNRWRTVTRFKGDAEFSAGGAPITLKVPGATVAYRGALRATAGDTVNVLPLDTYLRGVVAEEVPASWTPAAVQAQAVAARTYAAYERAEVSSARHFDVYDSTRSQVYSGVPAEQPGSDAAIEATRKEILTAGGAPAFTQFSASNGGWMSAGSQPYLIAKADPYDAAGGTNPHTDWSATISDTTLEQEWPTIGDLTRIDVPVRDGNGDFGGRADDVVLTGTAGAVTVSGENFRFLLGLKSDWFTFTIGG